MIEAIALSQNEYLASKTTTVKKDIGQYFTGSITATYMASIFDMSVKNKSEPIRILDAGAGSGILTIALAQHYLKLGQENVHAVLFETDVKILSLLELNMRGISKSFKDKSKVFTYDIRNEDFILARPDKTEEGFHASCINPPYFKYNVKVSKYAKAAADLYKGDPNIYASFLAVTLACMKKGGQMVTITPRSFANGLYFKGFRAYILTHSALSLIHVFKRRDKVFKSDSTSVLQENIICSFVKGNNCDPIIVRASDCDASLNNISEEKYPAELIIDPSNTQRLIRIPESKQDANILKVAETFKSTFEDAGYFISTGKVVEHRAKKYIATNTQLDDSVPLYRPHNITPFKTTWTGNNKKEVSFMLIDGHEKHTIRNDTYVLLKRFSSKDEKRRLISGIHFADQNPCSVIGFGNKMNYIGAANGRLSTIEAYGLVTIFNSSFMDKYFRCISGNTQVNATEIRVMKFPSREQVIEIGKAAQNLESHSIIKTDSIFNHVLGIKDVI
jgi:adenine-specific DNA-methyltransferase